MIKRFTKVKFVLLLFTVSLSNCVNLKQVYDFSSASLNSVQIFEGIDYSFKENCLDNCLNEKINNLNLSSKSCDCKANDQADSVTLLIYNAIKGYLVGLTNLSNNELTNYKMDALNKALTEGDFGSIKIEKTHVDAYLNISKVLLRAITDKYRKNKIKEYLHQGNESFKVLIHFLDFNLSVNLFGKLNVQKQKNESYYFDLTKDKTLSTLEKRIAVEKYFQQLFNIEAKQNKLLIYSKALNKIAEGHQKLIDNIDNISANEIKEQLAQYSSDINDIISEYKKLKN